MVCRHGNGLGGGVWKRESIVDGGVWNRYGGCFLPSDKNNGSGGWLCG